MSRSDGSSPPSGLIRSRVFSVGPGSRPHAWLRSGPLQGDGVSGARGDGADAGGDLHGGGPLGVGPVAELPVVVAPPTPQAAVGAGGAGMVVPGRHRSPG